MISTVCQTRRSVLNSLVARVNGRLRSLAVSHSWVIASHDLVRFSDLKDDVHLAPSGVAKLFRRLLRVLRVEFNLIVATDV